VRGFLRIVALAVCAALAAGQPEPGRRPFVLLGADQGLSAGAVVCMAQDRDGFLWMGSENGLLRYEGDHSRQWSAEDGLPSSTVPRLLATPDGLLWAGTLRGLVVFKDGRFHRTTFDGKPYVGSTGDLAYDRTGRVWLYTPEGLARQRQGLDFEFLPWKPPSSVYCVTAGPRSGDIHVAGQFGIQVFHEDGTTETWGPSLGLPPKGPVFALEDGKGRLWAGSGNILVMKAPGEDRFTDQSARLAANISPNGQPFLDRDGSVWIATQNGAQQLDGERLDASRGLPFRWVRTVFRDREGSLWVLGPGLAHMLGRARVQNYPLSQGDSGEVVWFMLRDAQGRMIAATDNGAVRMEAAGPRTIPGTGGWRIKGMALDRTGTLWMVNTRGPTLWLRPGQTSAEVAPLGEAGMGANSVYVDAKGTVWFGNTVQGIHRWDPAARRAVQDVPPAFAGRKELGVYEFHEDPQGRLWAGADGGILVRESGGQWKLYKDKTDMRIRGMAILPDGTAWIHAEEPGGITHVRLASEGLQVLERRIRGWGLASNMVYAVRRDSRGHIWVTTDKGLDRVDPPLHVGRHDGMLSEDCSVSAMLVEESIVWIGTSSGLVRYDGTGAMAQSAAPRAHIMQATFGKRVLEPPFGLTDPVPFEDGTVDFRVAAPTYLNRQEVRFQVRLQGLEDGWRDLDGNQVHLPALREGRYRFEVRAALAQSVFGPAEGFEFRVLPPWYRTGWAYGLYALAAALTVVGLVRVRSASLARSKAVLESLVALRTQELSLRNDELSEALGNVKQLSGLLPICAHCKKIRDDQGYWSQLELYVSRHSEVDFSHGICPDCATELFPEFLPRRDSGDRPC